ncbi:MAG: hypothetical protein J6P21_03740 [Clostridia bacterium]|nr:hypothetical protein [Clostridia bacterium]
MNFHHFYSFWQYRYNDIGNIFNALGIDRQIRILELMNEYLSTKDSYDDCKVEWEKQVNDLALEDEDKKVFAILFGIAVLAEPLRECEMMGQAKDVCTIQCFTI